MLARKTSHQSKELVASAIGLPGKQRERERKISDLESFWVWIRSTKSRPRRKKLHNKHVFQNQKSNAHAAEEEGTAGALALSGGGSCCHAMPRCRRAAATRAVAESKAVSSSSTTALSSSPTVLITTRSGRPGPWTDHHRERHEGPCPCPRRRRSIGSGRAGTLLLVRGIFRG